VTFVQSAADGSSEHILKNPPPQSYLNYMGIAAGVFTVGKI
jgi:hypothetical protein